VPIGKVFPRFPSQKNADQIATRSPSDSYPEALSDWFSGDGLWPRIPQNGVTRGLCGSF